MPLPESEKTNLSTAAEGRNTPSEVCRQEQSLISDLFKFYRITEISNVADGIAEDEKTDDSEVN